MPIKKVVTNSISDNAITTNKLSAGILDGMPPLSSIILWSGPVSSLGTGVLTKWALCDGTNGTPDLRDKFIIGAAGDGSVNMPPGITTGSNGPTTANFATQVVGQELLTSPTNSPFNWTCPANVTSVSVVCVGGGGGGGGSARSGGGGGGLGWKNNISVTPGTDYQCIIGAGGLGTSTTNADGGDGGDSYFKDISEVAGRGGKGGTSSGATPAPIDLGGDFVGDGGGKGGATITMQTNAHGGGGAGGYTGTGGSAVNNGGGTSGTGGAGGGGGDGGSTTSQIGSGGGGVGMFGLGADGAGGSGRPQVAIGGFGGSGGENGNNGTGAVVLNTSGNDGDGGLYGGGGGQQSIGQSGNGAQGAIRIIWPGDQRLFPDTYTQDISSNGVEPGDVEFYALAYIMRIP